jgi:site-specific DNA-methyltransferase (adenine-specific)
MTSHIENIDCMEFMRQFPNKYFDLAVVDPPYGIGAAKEKPHNGWKDWGIKKWDNQVPDAEYFMELFRVSKNQIVWGANHFISKMPYDSPCWLIWDKGQRDFSLADGEMAWSSFSKAMRIKSYSRPKALMEGKIHPTQKPVALYDWIFSNFAEPGMKIIDTHLGSGSSRISADKCGMNFWGCELDTEYFNAHQKRWENYKSQLTIF